MGHFETIPVWEEVSEEEYNNRSEEDSLLEFITTGYTKYKREPIYEKSGLLAIMDPNNKIIGYKYYKKVKDKTYYICSNAEYEYLSKKGQLRSNP